MTVEFEKCKFRGLRSEEAGGFTFGTVASLR